MLQQWRPSFFFFLFLKVIGQAPTRLDAQTDGHFYVIFDLNNVLEETMLWLAHEN